MELDGDDKFFENSEKIQGNSENIQDGKNVDEDPTGISEEILDFRIGACVAVGAQELDKFLRQGTSFFLTFL